MDALCRLGVSAAEASGGDGRGYDLGGSGAGKGSAVFGDRQHGDTGRIIIEPGIAIKGRTVDC